MNNTDRAVLITGCSSGIGKATALRLVQSKRFAVYATARKVADLAELTAAGAIPLALDVTREESMAAAVQAIEAKHGAIWGLVNNAGYSQTGAVEAVPLDRVRAQFETNVFGMVRLTQLALPAMRASRTGRIVNVSSMGGKITFPGFGVYHASKYAVEALSDALRFELRAFGVDVVVVEPGFIRSRFNETAVAEIPAMNADVATSYGAFHDAVAASTKAGYDAAPMSFIAGDSADVAAVVERALVKRRPRTRYTVAPSARMFIAQRRWFGDRAWDFAMRTMFPSPGAAPALPAVRP